MNTRKSRERSPRSLDTAYVLSNIELGNFVPFPASGIRHIHCDLDIPCTPRSRRPHHEMVIAKVV
jgi:hypothetical protein